MATYFGFRGANGIICHYKKKMQMDLDTIGKTPANFKSDPNCAVPFMSIWSAVLTMPWRDLIATFSTMSIVNLHK